MLLKLKGATSFSFLEPSLPHQKYVLFSPFRFGLWFKDRVQYKEVFPASGSILHHGKGSRPPGMHPDPPRGPDLCPLAFPSSSSRRKLNIIAQLHFRLILKLIFFPVHCAGPKVGHFGHTTCSGGDSPFLTGGGVRAAPHFTSYQALFKGSCPVAFQ